MGHEFKAGAEFTHQKCLLVHGNIISGSHVDTSFFKVMFGKQFSNFMELPPKVASVVLLSDQKTFLEDSLGLRWEVEILSVNGSLSFQQGWNAFALDHDLQVGNFLVFNYIPGSHFTVNIYDNSGCELRFFETLHPNKRKRDHTDGRCHSIVKSSMSKSGSDTCAGSDAEISKHLNEMNGMKKPLIITENASNHDDNNERSKRMCKTEFSEEMSYMMNREYGDKQGGNRAPILDFFSLEMFKKAPPSDKDLSTNVTSGHPFPTVPENPEQNEESFSGISNRATKNCQTADASGNDQVAVSGKKHDLIDDRCQSANKKFTVISKSYDKAMKIIELEPVELTSDPCSQEVIPEKKGNDQVAVSGKKHDLIDDRCQSANKKFTVISKSYDKAMKIIELEPVELTSDPCSQEVIPEKKGNDQVAVSGKEHDLIDDRCQSANKKFTGISKSSDKAMKIESVDLTSDPCSQEVIPERNDKVRTIIEKESLELTSDPCSQEVIPERKDEVKMIVENVIVDLTSDPCSQVVIEKVQLNAEESLDLSTKVDNQSSTSNTRAIPSDAAEFERTEEINKTEAKVRKMPSGKDSCIETSGHPFPTHSENPEENVETVSDTSKTTSDVSNKVTKECQTAEGSELSSGNDQVEISQNEPDLIDANKKLTGISESMHIPITSGCQNDSGESLKISYKLQNLSNFARENDGALPVVKPEPVDPDEVATCTSFMISCLVATGRQSFLELPKSLPVSLNTTRARPKLDRRIVFLQGPDERLWPVLYIQKYYFRTLANGWEAFSMANNIEQGDQCTFEVKSQTEAICSVQVIKSRAGGMEIFGDLHNL